MNPTSTTASSVTLRPRNRRQTQDEDEPTSSTTPKLSNYRDPPASAQSSRATSPIPQAHPSRPTRVEDGTQTSRSKSRFLGVPSSSLTFATGLWGTSWSSLQGIASNLIGTDVSRGSSPGRSPPRRRKPLEFSHERNTSAPPARWGPSGKEEKQLGLGTRDDRRAQVQAKKRETLLAANGVVPDASGRYKRRDSEENDRGSVPPGANDDREALVYLHKVKPADTLAGVIIKYSCQPNVFRKANRLWPNDSIQVRETVVLPVDACGVRGRKIHESDGTLSNFGDNYADDIMPTPTNPQHPWGEMQQAKEQKETPFSSIPTSPSISISLSNADEPPWKHDSWVMIDGFPDAVEIARLSCKTLGYFPRSRRKSQTFSDLETPSASLDLPRTSSHQSSSPLQPTPRSRSGSFFTNQLQGPGGVGTMGKNVHGPGPAQDGLNKLFATHLPNPAPKPSSESLHRCSNPSQSHTHANGGIENLGGSIEGWVRKIAVKASSSLQPSPTPRGRSIVGDLIELSEDVFDLRHETTQDQKRSQPSCHNPGTTGASWPADEERSSSSLLEERFPPRGRVFGDSSRRGKSS